MNREMDGQLTIHDETEFTSIAVTGPAQVIALPRGVVLLMATSSAISNGKISAAFGKKSGPASSGSTNVKYYHHNAVSRQPIVMILTAAASIIGRR